MSNALPVLVSGRSWDWLRELCRPLGLQAQLIDATGAALLPPQSLPGVISLDELIGDAARPILAAVTSGFQSASAQTMTLDSTDIVCAPLTHEGRTRGMLVIARPARSGAQDAITGQQLNTVSGWLAGAVERHLSSTPAGPDNLTALHKVLQHAVQSGTDRELVTVFAEALALWHDIEVVGYVETAPGVFVRAASLAGRMAEDRPIVFPPQSLPPELKITRIPQSDINGMETAGAGEVLVTTLSRGGDGCWLLTMSGAIDGCDRRVVGNYVSALDMAVALAAAAARTRLAMLLSHRLSATTDSGGGFDAGLEAVRAALSARTVEFAVESPGRRVVYQAGSPESASGAEPDRARAIVRRLLPGGDAATLTLVRNDHRHFTPLEHGVGVVAAELLADWAVRPAHHEAGEAVSVFGRTMEKLARETLERGLAVTAVVVSTSGSAPGAAQVFVDELRRQMRQSDVVGVLRPGEVGLLLLDTTAAHAAAVARRLRSALGEVGTNSSIKTIGFATRIPGEGVADGILSDARANAQQRGGNGVVHSAAG